MKSATDFFAFGMGMPDRTFSTGDYRYGFNGKEKDDEVKGSGNSYDYGARIYEPRVGRWLACDPLAKKYAELSPYQYCANNPIMFIDPDGKVIVVPNVADRAPILKMINSKALGVFAFNTAGELYQVKATGDETKYSTYYRDKLVAAINDPETIEINISSTYVDRGVTKSVDTDQGGGLTAKTSTSTGAIVSPVKVTISGNENTTTKDETGATLEVKAADILVHELVGHSIPAIVGTDTGNAVKNENKVRAETGAKLRAAESTASHPEL